MQALHTLAIAGPRESGAAVIFESSFCRLRSVLALRLDAHSEEIRKMERECTCIVSTDTITRESRANRENTCSGPGQP